MTTAVVIMSKIPLPGYTKTRLMPDLTGSECASFHRACLSDICQTVITTGYTGFLYFISQQVDQVMPDNKNLLGLSRDTLRYFRLRSQNGKDLGQRMSQAIREVLVDFTGTIVIGSDIPELNSSILQETVKRLRCFDVVLGPAGDGGYYLVAMTKIVPEIFTDIPWGTNNVLDITLEKLTKAKKAFTLMPELHDIDTWEDINLFYRRGNNAGKDYDHLSSYHLAERLITKKTCAQIAFSRVNQ
jgi:rSAM/selenodomain-associated transferase 1